MKNKNHFGGSSILRQKGQALVEFIVWSIVIIPLILMIAMLGKYADLNQTALQASRYAAWEKTVTTQEKINPKSDAQLAEEIRARFFSNVGRHIKTGGSVKDSNKEDRNGFHEDHHGGLLVKTFSDVSVTTTKSKPAFGVKGNLLSDAGSIFKLPSDNLWRADVGVTVARIPLLTPLDRLNLNVARHNVILTDAWEAGSVAGEVTRLKNSSALAPSVKLAEQIRPLTGWMKEPMAVIEPAFKYFKLDSFVSDPLPVPKDRR
ncbi:MAG: TadE family protein [Pseudomonadota bacterium]